MEPLLIDSEHRIVHIGEEAIRLTPMQVALLATLNRKPGKRASYHALLASYYTDCYERTKTNLRPVISQLRRLLRPYGYQIDSLSGSEDDGGYILHDGKDPIVLAVCRKRKNSAK